MAEHIRKCIEDQRYTMQRQCPACNKETTIPKPPKFSLQDRYASMRRESKKQELKEKGLF